MDWNDCLDEKVTKTSPNKKVSRSLLTMCRARLEVVGGMPRKYPALIAEVYYEIIKELITALLSIQGFKSYSHKCLISFLKEYHYEVIKDSELALLEKLRVIRNDIGYRGVMLGEEFLERNEEKIKLIIRKLDVLVEGKLQ